MKLNYPKEWFEKSALIEGDDEIGAGVPPVNWCAREDEASVESRIALGQFVELWRRDKGWNAERLANEAGIDTGEVLELEKDPHHEPEPDAVYKLANVFGVSSRKMMELAGLVQNRNPYLREEAIRFAAQADSISKLTDAEQQSLEAFVSALTLTN